MTRFSEKYAGRWAETRGPRGPLALLVPTTFMNDSGRCVGPAAGSLRITPEQLVRRLLTQLAPPAKPLDSRARLAANP